MDTNLTDVILHIDEDLDNEQRETIEESLRALDGVVSVH
ncbi:MAG: ATP-binding protein, partial [Desulforhopalus sp.]|nr:ATP-binding protein [Desulforhopalus sp.]